MKLIDKLFQREEMDGDGRCPTYLVRWTLLKLWGGIGLYLHHFVGDDWSLDLHDHPKRFVSLGLWGRYVEETPAIEFFGGSPHSNLPDSRLTTRGREYRAPWIRTFPAEHIHRIRLVNKRPCWTVVLVLRTSRPWGFWDQRRWIPWREYVGSEQATKRKSCP